MDEVGEIRHQLLDSHGYEVVERLRSFDIAYAAFKHYHKSLIELIESPDRTQYELSRNLVAYSGTITPLRDQAERLKSEMTEAHQREYTDKLHEEVDLEASDFLIEIRHYVQHTQIPYLVSPDDKPPRHFGNDVQEGVYVHIGELQERGRDFRKDKAVEFIRSHDEQLIELKPLMQRYFESSLAFNRWVADTYRQENEAALGEAQKLIEQLTTAIE